MASFLGIATTPDSWVTLREDVEGDPPGYERILDEASSAGYDGIELGDYGLMPVEPEVLRDVLSEMGLALAGAFLPVPIADPDARVDGTEEAIRVAQLLADAADESPLLILADEYGKDTVRSASAGRVELGQGYSMQEWQVAAHTANQLALSVLNETGIRTAFHPHCASHIETAEELEILMDVTHPQILGLCVDTGHYAYAGGDPLQVLRRYADRVWHVHLKGYNAAVTAEARDRGLDYVEAVGEGIFCELEQSAFDSASLITELEALEYSGWLVVEQDASREGSTFEIAERNRAFLRDLEI
ncbi:MAG: TIM barrel protein [Candidatus Latescibacteria bacterium]|jgi:inosose dehydratase|nr:TIM barrel protein [Candidatus Latescibacterota bacterium]